MSLARRFAVLSLFALLLSTSIAPAQTPLPTSFTYQGRLDETGLPANGSYDLQFSLWSAPSGGSQIGTTLCTSNLQVTGGLFTVPLDFGATAFNGDARYLQIGVRPAGPPNACASGTYTLLAPRQPLSAAPYALQTRGLYVDANRNVGIGATPSSKLTVAGGLSVFDTLNQGVTLTADTFTFTNASNEDITYSYTYPADRHDFWTSGAQSLTIDNTGNIGLGMGSRAPEGTLHINRPSSRVTQIFETSRIAPGTTTQTTPRSPTSALAAPSAGSNWTTPTNALTSNNQRATVTLTRTDANDASGTSDALRFTGFGFAIPAGATITGFDVLIEGQHNYVCSNPPLSSVELRASLIANGVPASLRTGRSTTSTDSTVSIGGELDNWDRVWTVSEVNSASFGLQLVVSGYCEETICTQFGPQGCISSYNQNCDTCSGTGSYSLDAVQIVVHYREAPTRYDPATWALGIPAQGLNFILSPATDLSNPAMVITPDGRVGIHAEPGSVPLTQVESIPMQLDVHGPIRVTSTTYAPYLAFFDGVVRCNTLIQSSAARFKSDIRPLDDGLDLLLQLKPVRFRWNASHGGHNDLGFIAEDVLKVIPEVVPLSPDGTTSGIDYSHLTAVTVDAVQTQQKQIDALRAENAALKARLDRLESLLLHKP